MHRQLSMRVMSIAMMLLTVITAQAFSTALFASKSKMSSGRWVKIAVEADGVYELTNDELRAMGFESPERVRIYGWGGHMLSERLIGNHQDDMVQVPIKRYADKVCFYANGPVGYELNTSQTGVKRAYLRSMNAYSNYGYYFVSDFSDEELLVSEDAHTPTDLTTGRATSLDYLHHERELFNKGLSGKDLLGEEMGASGTTSFEVELPQVCVDTITVMVRSALNASSSPFYTNASFTTAGVTTTLPLPLSTARIYPISTGMMYYQAGLTGADIVPEEVDPAGTLNLWYTAQTSSGSLKNSWLDYFIVTYTHRNVITADGQVRMGLYMQRGDENIVLPEASENIEVWNVNTAGSPVSYATVPFDDGTTAGRAFMPGTSRTWGQYVAFDPTLTLKKIASYEPVANQNLHGYQAPDMVIVTNAHFLPQAERVAQLHRDHDGMDVIVVDQQQVFNEFSSGTPDAMGVRLFCKMLYDRDKTRFKHLLMFGHGSYDNRNLTGSRENLVITYETDNSTTEDMSYASDDFFGILDDNTGYDLSSELLRLGVGRFTSSNIDEAAGDVDKLIEYVTEPDYGPWRNNAVYIADSGDDGLHEFQAEGISLLVEGQTPTHTNRVFNAMYPRDVLEAYTGGTDWRTATEAKKLWASLMEQGQYYATYVGHAGPTNFSATGHMWGISDVQEHNNRHLPIMTTACCDVARYDSDQRGVADLMFHKRDGGAIALVTSSRSVYADDNDALNQAFTNAMFSYASTGKMPTVGEAYMKAKQAFGTSQNHNKMSFLLLGDPAIKINYPLPLFNITKVNGEELAESGNLNVYPLQELTIEAQVVDDEGNLDTDFNGDATITLYDAPRYFHTVVSRVNRVDVERDINYTALELSTITGRVENGVFTGKLIVPRQCGTGNVAIRTYAHKDDSERMVNGVSPAESLKLNAYDASKVAVIDTEAPVINSFYLGDEEQFAGTLTVTPATTLHIDVSDNVGINVQAATLGNAMALLLDGNKSLYTVRNFVSLSDEGRAATIDYPMSDLTAGRHTLTYTVSDLSGNVTAHTVQFYVDSSDTGSTLTVENEPAVNEAVFTFKTGLTTALQVTYKVTDAMGNLVWKQDGDASGIVWDLTGLDGNRVKPGLYKYYATYDDGTTNGGTPIGELVVLDPVISNK